MPFVTPVKQPSHRRPVGFRMHECLHRGFGRPTRTGPKRVPPIPQQFGREVAVGPCSLPSNSQRLNKERREIGPRPNTKTRNGNDWHKFFPPPIPNCLVEILRSSGGKLGGTPKGKDKEIRVRMGK